MQSPLEFYNSVAYKSYHDKQYEGAAPPGAVYAASFCYNVRPRMLHVCKKYIISPEKPALRAISLRTTLAELELESRVIGNYLARFGEHFIISRERETAALRWNS